MTHVNSYFFFPEEKTFKTVHCSRLSKRCIVLDKRCIVLDIFCEETILRAILKAMEFDFNGCFPLERKSPWSKCAISNLLVYFCDPQYSDNAPKNTSQMKKTVTPDDNFEFRPGRLTQLQSNKNKISKQKFSHV